MADGAGPRTGSGADACHDSEREMTILNRLRDGSIKIYELEKELSPIDAIRVRREFIAQETGQYWKISVSSPLISSALSGATVRT